MTHLPYGRQAIDDDHLRTLSGARPGTPVPDDLVDSSDRAQPRLDLAAIRAMVERVV